MQVPRLLFELPDYEHSEDRKANSEVKKRTMLDVCIHSHTYVKAALRQASLRLAHVTLREQLRFAQFRANATVIHSPASFLHLSHMREVNIPDSQIYT